MTPATVEPPAVVVGEVCARYGVTFDAILGPGRAGLVAAARRAVIEALASRTAMSKCDIGRYLGRDHTTVLYHLNGGRR